MRFPGGTRHRRWSPGSLAGLYCPTGPTFQVQICHWALIALLNFDPDTLMGLNRPAGSVSTIHKYINYSSRGSSRHQITQVVYLGFSSRGPSCGNCGQVSQVVDPAVVTVACINSSRVPNTQVVDPVVVTVLLV